MSQWFTREKIYHKTAEGTLVLRDNGINKIKQRSLEWFAFTRLRIFKNNKRRAKINLAFEQGYRQAFGYIAPTEEEAIQEIKGEKGWPLKIRETNDGGLFYYTPITSMKGGKIILQNKNAEQKIKIFIPTTQRRIGREVDRFLYDCDVAPGDREELQDCIMKELGFPTKDIMRASYSLSIEEAFEYCLTQIQREENQEVVQEERKIPLPLLMF